MEIKYNLKKKLVTAGLTVLTGLGAISMTSGCASRKGYLWYPTESKIEEIGSGKVYWGGTREYQKILDEHRIKELDD